MTSSVEMPTGLEKRVMARVEKAVRRRFFERITAGGAVSVFFAVIFVVVGHDTLSEIATSGFGQYLSLVFSNGGVVMSDWRNFAWIIVESAPVTGLALCLGIGGMFIGSIRWTGRAFGMSGHASSKLAI
jgi:hypothetical protein